MTEAELQDAIVQWAHIGGWKVAHFAAARTLHGWRTPARYDATGWPDLIGIHPDSVSCDPFAWELKSGRGKPTDDQEAWLDLLDANGFCARIIQPKDLDWCIEYLTAHMGVELA